MESVFPRKSWELREQPSNRWKRLRQKAETGRERNPDRVGRGTRQRQDTPRPTPKEKQTLR